MYVYNIELRLHSSDHCKLHFPFLCITTVQSVQTVCSYMWAHVKARLPNIARNLGECYAGMFDRCRLAQPLMETTWWVVASISSYRRVSKFHHSKLWVAPQLRLRHHSRSQPAELCMRSWCSIRALERQRWMVVRQEVKNQGRKQQAVCVCVCVCVRLRRKIQKEKGRGSLCYGPSVCYVDMVG